MVTVEGMTTFFSELLTSEGHIADDLRALGYRYAVLRRQAVNQTLTVNGVYSITVEIEVIPINLLQCEIEHQHVKTVAFLRVL